MAVFGTILKDRFEGCLLGLAIGDALGGKFEAQTAHAICARFPTLEQLITYPQEEIWYTDDTQMAIGVAEAVVEWGGIVEDALCRAFVANYDQGRRVLELRFSGPFERFRTVIIRLGSGITAFDNQPLTPFELRFTIGG